MTVRCGFVSAGAGSTKLVHTPHLEAVELFAVLKAIIAVGAGIFPANFWVAVKELHKSIFKSHHCKPQI